jgi:hypothetical protein
VQAQIESASVLAGRKIFVRKVMENGEKQDLSFAEEKLVSSE